MDDDDDDDDVYGQGYVSETALASLRAILDCDAKPTLDQVKPFVRLLYKHHCVGGALHIVLDDGNLKDSHIQHCIDYAVEKGDTFAQLLGRVLIRMSRTQRAALYNDFDLKYRQQD